MKRMKLARTIGASGLCLVAAVCMQSWGGPVPWQLWIPTLLLAEAALLSFHRSSGSQLLVRAVLWSNLLLAAVIAWCGSHREIAIAGALGGSTGAALLALGKAGLDDARGRFVPVAFRGTLIALLVMALADAQTLALWGSLFVEKGWSNRGAGLITLAIAVAFIAGVAGLYRLRAWGLLINSVAAVGLIVAAACGVFREVSPFGWVLAGSGALQLVLVAPLYRALHRGAAEASALRRTGVWAGGLIIAGLSAGSMAPAAWQLLHR
jgi:hypothetical protein